MRISIGVLAGGKSSRMGQDKALLAIDDQRFLDRITKELGAFNEVLLSVANKGDYADTGLPAFVDEHREIGPLEGIYQLVKHASNEYVFVCAVDMPFVTAELVEYMAEFISSDHDCYVMTDEEHIHPLCAIYSKAVLPVIEELITEGRYRLREIFKRVRTKYIRLETSCFETKVLRNINTKEEYAKLVLPVVFCVSAVKDSGKTGLIIKLINEFIREGYRVGAIKHDGHDYVMDYEGTDTNRFFEAGAVVSSIFSDTKSSIQLAGKRTLEEMIDFAKKHCDIIVIEGAKYSLHPKIEVVRGAVSDSLVCDEHTLICVATDILSQDSVSCPIYGLDDVGGIFLCVKKYFGLEFSYEAD
ncbi:MAG: molybdopterin-guanine dinucleotide biosynthesis protein B [Acetatifactor sp.]|nr:molybdopterin-guanine dinucleotide biosynthesis protein B [Acetatifactor sp.]